MSDASRYLTLESEESSVLREQASRFLGHAFPVADEAAFKARFDRLAREHHSARHHCYAWVLGPSGERHRAHDADEPAGTAGRPILRALQERKLTFTAVVVVRYFGGTLLGKAGLVRAYGDCARAALDQAVVVERIMRSPLVVLCNYSLLESLREDVLRREGLVERIAFGEQCTLAIELPAAQIASFTARWSILGATVRIDQEK